MNSAAAQILELGRSRNGVFMKTVLSFFSVILFSANGFSQTSSSAEVMCRGQAKEIAMQTYSSCITQARATQVEDIRKNYQKELADLKTKYDQELKRLNGKVAEANKKGPKVAAPAPVAVAKPLKSAQPVKGVAKQLPAKNAQSAETLPVQTVAAGTKVVAIETPEASLAQDPVELEAAQAEDVEIIDMSGE